MSYYSQLQNLAVTPTLWSESSTVYPADYYGGELEAAAAEDYQFSEPEEKMDMLWEEFNEELQRVYSLKDKKMAGAVKLSNEQSAAAAGVKRVEFCCAQAKGNSNRRMINNKRSGKYAVLVTKYFKKLSSTSFCYSIRKALFHQ